jgi:hypothetical protein
MGFLSMHASASVIDQAQSTKLRRIVLIFFLTYTSLDELNYFLLNSITDAIVNSIKQILLVIWLTIYTYIVARNFNYFIFLYFKTEALKIKAALLLYKLVIVGKINNGRHRCSYIYIN